MCQFKDKEKNLNQLCNFYKSFFYLELYPSVLFLNEENKVLGGKKIKIYRIKGKIF